MHLACQLFKLFINTLKMLSNKLKHRQKSPIPKRTGEEKNTALSPKTDNLSQLILRHYKSMSYVSLFRDSENTLCRKMQTTAIAIIKKDAITCVPSDI